MLERAATCLKSGGRQLIRSSRRSLRSRRMLHAAFWHHDASDLALPTWWADTACPGHDATFLDFLYPAKTLALLCQLSGHRSDSVLPRRRRQQFLHGLPVRQFSTARPHTLDDESVLDVGLNDETTREVQRLLRGSQAITVLPDFLRTSVPGKHELAWRLYRAIPTAHLARGHYAMRQDLIEYLNHDDNPQVPTRVLHLFQGIPNSRRRATSYRAAIAAYIALRMVGPAVRLLDQVPAWNKSDLLHVGIDLILRRAVFDRQWDLGLRVIRIFSDTGITFKRKNSASQIHLDVDLPSLWNNSHEPPDMISNLGSFIQHVHEFQHELYSSERKAALSTFAALYIPQALAQVLKSSLDDSEVKHFILETFDKLNALGLATPRCYERVIQMTSCDARFQKPVTKDKIWLELYDSYRQPNPSIPDPILSVKPSKSVLRDLILHQIQFDDGYRVQELIEEHRTLYPNSPLQQSLLQRLVHWYADLGHAERVMEYFEEMRKNYRGSIDLKQATALLYVFARRVDVKGTMTQFNRLKAEFGFAPNAACWNILILAHARAEDLDGALRCLNQFLDTGLEPDAYTFGPLLDLCAKRGDIEAYEFLFSRGQDMGVPMQSDVRARSGYVELLLNAGDVEGAQEIAQGMLRSKRAGILHSKTLTHTWNLLIQHFALHKDLERSRRIYREMVDNDIPLDSWTYGSLMRALIEVRQTNAAFKILRITMPENNLPAHALHYAIVMTGFLREGQVFLAEIAYRHMLKQGIPQTPSSHQAAIQTLGTSDLLRLESEGHKSESIRLQAVEKALENMLVGTGSALALRQPEHGQSLDARGPTTVPQAYYGLLTSLYASRDAFKICRKLSAKALQMGGRNALPSLTLIVAIMEFNYRAGNHIEVAKYWQLAWNCADQLSKSLREAIRPGKMSVAANAPVLDHKGKGPFDPRISPKRRQILFKASRIYIRSLLDPSNPQAGSLDQAQLAVRSLLDNGYTIDNLVWNELVQGLTRRGRLVDAFSTCEQHLMPTFPGWRCLNPSYVRKDLPGYQYMELRQTEINKRSVLPRYKTLVVLAHALGQVREDERNGVGYDSTTRKWMRERLEATAPTTLRAIESMPRTNDRLQSRYIFSTT